MVSLGSCGGPHVEGRDALRPRRKETVRQPGTLPVHAAGRLGGLSAGGYSTGVRNRILKRIRRTRPGCLHARRGRWESRSGTIAVLMKFNW